jgi:putative FmdB family regulatory protein
MPTYEYRCPKGHQFEKFYPRITRHPTATCPRCGKRARRLISGGAGLVFKGSGFYITDYKRADRKGAEPPESTKASDTKPEPKPEPKADKSDRKAGKKDSADT